MAPTGEIFTSNYNTFAVAQLKVSSGVDINKILIFVRRAKYENEFGVIAYSFRARSRGRLIPNSNKLIFMKP